MAQKKDTAVSIAARREMATLLESAREASARIRVENIIQTDICVELMEILELYAELLLARAGLLDARDKALKDGTSGGGGEDVASGLEEAAASIIYAAPRLPREVRELGIVRAMLVERLGKEFALRAQENRDECVPRRVTEKLKVEQPKESLVTAYLAEIARTYGVEWPRRREGEEEEEMQGLGREVDDEEEEGDPDGGEGGGGKEMPIAIDMSGKEQTQTPTKKNRVDLGQVFDRDELSRATPPRDIGPGGAKSAVSVAPPGPRSDNLSPRVKLPDGKTAAAAAQAKNVVPGAVPTVDDLAKRFSALKR
jgi:vacuolar protein sorting-associated protein IST1